MSKPKPTARRSYGTIGDLERAAGIGPSYEERFAFWVSFAHLKDQCFEAARAELHRRIEMKSSAKLVVTPS